MPTAAGAGQATGRSLGPGLSLIQVMGAQGLEPSFVAPQGAQPGH